MGGQYDVDLMVFVGGQDVLKVVGWDVFVLRGFDEIDIQFVMLVYVDLVVIEYVIVCGQYFVVG